MPLYEYKCKTCGTTFEVMQKFSDAPLKVHEKCGGTVEKLLSTPSFHFKGTGWYVTDYGKKGSASSNGKSSTKDGADSTKSDTAKPDSVKSSSPAESKPAPASTSPATK